MSVRPGGGGSGSLAPSDGAPDLTAGLSCTEYGAPTVADGNEVVVTRYVGRKHSRKRQQKEAAIPWTRPERNDPVIPRISVHGTEPGFCTSSYTEKRESIYLLLL